MVKRLLCVDDDRITLTFIKLLVTKASFASEIITKMNGKEAIDYYGELSASSTEHYPDLVFLDLNMPYMDGWEFLDEFAGNYYQQFNKTKIVILSSSRTASEKNKALAYPMVVDYLTKPLTIGALTDLIALV